MQDFASEEEVGAWVQAQPHGMGRLKLGLLVGEGRLSERGMAMARHWLAGGGELPGRIEPVLEPALSGAPAAPVPPPVVPAMPGADRPPPPLFPAVPPATVAAQAPVPEPPLSAPPVAAVAPERPARRRRLRFWLEAITILLLLGVAYGLLTELARVAGRTT